MTPARLSALGVAAVCGLISVFLALNGRDASLVRKANEAGAAGRLDEALAHARKVERAPAEARALVAIARAHTAAGRPAEADRAWARAARRDPNNWQIHYEWARAVAILGGETEAIRRHYGRARELNPRLAAAP